MKYKVIRVQTHTTGNRDYNVINLSDALNDGWKIEDVHSNNEFMIYIMVKGD